MHLHSSNYRNHYATLVVGLILSFFTKKYGYNNIFLLIRLPCHIVICHDNKFRLCSHAWSHAQGKVRGTQVLLYDIQFLHYVTCNTSKFIIISNFFGLLYPLTQSVTLPSIENHIEVPWAVISYLQPVEPFFGLGAVITYSCFRILLVGSFCLHTPPYRNMTPIECESAIDYINKFHFHFLLYHHMTPMAYKGEID